tara:strand:- start:986 stop:1147 length:162 start_codon:yes stop_codon:yes gene_type:complete
MFREFGLDLLEDSLISENHIKQHKSDTRSNDIPDADSIISVRKAVNEIFHSEI